MTETVRLYYYTSKTWGLKTLWERRLKISRFAEVNDPFELSPFNRTSKRSRQFWESQVERIVESDHGFISFSNSWRSGQMWAHYGDKQRGLCFGFDVLRPYAEPITYVDEPLDDPFPHRVALRKLPVEVVEAATRFKNKVWGYEHEWRVRAPLTVSQDGVFYMPFDRGIELREIILGPRCSLSPGDVVHAVESPPLDVEIYSTRPAHGTFAIERHELVSSHDIKGYRAELSEAPDALWGLGDDRESVEG